MDDKNAMILDISSDEENGGGGGGGDDFYWLSKLLHDDDGGGHEDYTGESDDVVVVGEVFVNRKQRIKSSKVVDNCGVVDDDDDCVVLDGDPEKSVPIENEKKNGDFDDLMIISEKGQVACRDFPHPRHLCAKFPFASTPHERHCDQCHCYVCDSLAPCVFWGTGLSSIDHCHATEKREFWKAQRKSTKRNDKAQPVVPAFTDTTLSVRPLLTNQPPPLTSNRVQQNQFFGQATIRSCSMPTSNGTLNFTRQGRSQHSGHVVQRSKFQPHLVSQHLHRVSNHKRHNFGIIDPPISRRMMVATRMRSVRGALTTDRNGCNSSHHNYGSQFSRNPPSMARWQGSSGGVTSESNVHQDSYQPNVGQIAANSMPSQTELPTQPILRNGFANYMPTHPQMPSQQQVSSGYANYALSHPQVSSQQHISSGYANYVPQTSSQLQVTGAFANSVPSQPHVGGNFGDSLPSQPQIASQPLAASNFKNPMPSQPQVTSLSQQNRGRTSEYSDPSEHLASCQFKADNCFQNPVSSQPMTSSLPYIESTFETPSSPQAQEHKQSTSMPNNNQNIFQQGNQSQDASASGFVDSDFSWLNYSSQSCQQLSLNNSQPQSAEPTNNPSANMELYSHFPGSTDFGPSDLQFDNWIFEHQPASGALEVSVPPGLNVPSPEPASVNGGLFFDI